MNWDDLKKEWETTDISLSELAEKHNVKLGTLKSRKSREKWTKGGSEKDATSNQVDASTKKAQQSAATQEKSERKRGGNPNPPNQFTKRNNAAEKHGLYKRVIPADLQDVFDELDNGISLVDMLWDQIKIQYIAIMRAQSIMFVKEKDELVKELKKVRYDVAPNIDGEFEPVITEEEYEIQFAWDRYATFLNAQSRAISELRSVINQFEEMADKADARLLKLQQLRVSIDKSNIELETLKKNDGDQVTKVVFVDDILRVN